MTDAAVTTLGLVVVAVITVGGNVWTASIARKAVALGESNKAALLTVGEKVDGQASRNDQHNRDLTEMIGTAITGKRKLKSTGKTKQATRQ